MRHTIKMIRGEFPSYRITLTESMDFHANPVDDSLPHAFGSMTYVVRFVAAQQGWPTQDITDTLRSFTGDRVTNPKPETPDDVAQACRDLNRQPARTRS